MDLKKSVYIKEHDNESKYDLTEKMYNTWAPPQREHGIRLPSAQSFGEHPVAHDFVMSMATIWLDRPSLEIASSSSSPGTPPRCTIGPYEGTWSYMSRYKLMNLAMQYY